MASLDVAENAFRTSAMALHAEVMRARRAALESKPARGELLRELGLVRPDRWIALLAPGRWT